MDLVTVMVVDREKAIFNENERKWLRERGLIQSSMTLAYRRRVSHRDVLRLSVAFLKELGLKNIDVAIAGDAESGHGWHVGFSVEIDEGIMLCWFNEQARKRRLGYGIFAVPGIHDVQYYMAKHLFYAEKTVLTD